MKFETLTRRFLAMHDTIDYDCYFRFQDKDLDSSGSKTMAELGIVDGSTITVQVSENEEEDIGLFEFPNRDHLGNHLLCFDTYGPTRASTSTSSTPKKEVIEDLIASVPIRHCVAGVPGDPSLPAVIPNCLTQEDCETLIHYIKERDQDSSIFDLQLHLTQQELAELLSKATVEHLQSSVFGGSPLNSIRLRRICATNEKEKKQGKCINFHRDFAIKTLQIALNSNQYYTGGRLVFALSAPMDIDPSLTVLCRGVSAVFFQTLVKVLVWSARFGVLGMGHYMIIR